ncbi:MAG TPA: hypothetical protein VLB80_02180 [Candidatus Babeliales bacterium]|nr:hypothetical protein [Candidatus Babeliales bacterium]
MYTIQQITPSKNITNDTKNSLKNFIANISNITAAAITKNPLLLLPLFPQVSHEISKKIHHSITEQRNECQLYKDLKYFINIMPQTIDHIKNMEKIDEKIHLLKKKYDPANMERLELIKILEAYNKKISELQKSYADSHRSIIKDITPLFKSCTSANITQALENNTNNLIKLNYTDLYTQCNSIFYLPLIFVPLLFKSNERGLENFIQGMLTGVLTYVEGLCIFAYINNMPFSAQSAVVLSLVLSTIANYNNHKLTSAYRTKMNQERSNLEYIIKILKIQQNNITPEIKE